MTDSGTPKQPLPAVANSGKELPSTPPLRVPKNAQPDMGEDEDGLVLEPTPQEFAEQEQQEESEPELPPGIESYDQFLSSSEAQHRQWFWDGVMPATGVVMLAAASMSGKTTLVMQLATAMKTGGEVGGRSVRKGRMLIVKLEHSDADYGFNLKRVVAGAGLPNLKGTLFFARGLNLDDDEHMTDFLSVIDELGVDVVVVDPLRRVSSFDENSSQHGAAVGKQLDAMTGGGKRLVLVIHHLNKGGGVRGSTDLTAMVDSTVLLYKSGDNISVDVEHHIGPPTKFSLSIEGDDGSLRLVAAKAKESLIHGKVSADICTFLKTGPKSKGEIRDGVKGGSEAKDTAVKQLAAAGVIKNQGSPANQQWVLCEPQAAKESSIHSGPKEEPKKSAT